MKTWEDVEKAIAKIKAADEEKIKKFRDRVNFTSMTKRERRFWLTFIEQREKELALWEDFGDEYIPY